MYERCAIRGVHTGQDNSSYQEQQNHRHSAIGDKARRILPDDFPHPGTPIIYPLVSNILFHLLVTKLLLITKLKLVFHQIIIYPFAGCQFIMCARFSHLTL